MRDDQFLRGEIRWLIERATATLGLEPESIQGVTSSEIDEACRAQDVSGLPPGLDEFLRVAGSSGAGSVTEKLFGDRMPGGPGFGSAKNLALEVAALSRFDHAVEHYGLDRSLAGAFVFWVEPGVAIQWIQIDGSDPPINMIGRWPDAEFEYVYVTWPRFADWLETHVIAAEFSARGRSETVLLREVESRT